MTTIAYRDGVLAGDTLHSSENGWALFHARKVWRLRDGRLVGGVHFLAQIHNFKLWLAQGKKENPPGLGDSSVLVVAQDGRQLQLYEGGGMFVLSRQPFFALGSGRIVALAGMKLGLTAKEAVKLAMKLDTGTGGRVISVSLRPKGK